MANPQLHVDIITPESTKFAGLAESIQLPGLEGQIGILKDHTPLVTMLGAGPANIHVGGGVVERVIIGDGFATVFENRVTCLVDAAVKIDEIKREAVMTRVSELDRAHQEAGRLSDSLQSERAYLRAQLDAV